MMTTALPALDLYAPGQLAVEAKRPKSPGPLLEGCNSQRTGHTQRRGGLAAAIIGGDDGDPPGRDAEIEDDQGQHALADAAAADHHEVARQRRRTRVISHVFLSAPH